MFLYRLLSVLALLAYAPYALLRSVTGRRRIGDVRGRLGLDPYPDLAGGIWVHAVSVGEVSVAHNLLESLKKRLPGVPLGLSATTAAGLDAARRLAGPGIEAFSFPLDLAGPVEKALAAVRPALIVLVETELWPLLLERARTRDVLVALVNGRISDRSFRRYLLLRRWFSRILENVSLFAMQTPEDADRIARFGAPQGRILVTGNIKYDISPAPPFADAVRLTAAAAGRQILVAASTSEGEERIVLEAWKDLDPRPFLVLAPRRPERFDEVASLAERSGFSLIRRSLPSGASFHSLNSQLSTHNSPLDSPPDIYLLDSIGELFSLYRQAFLAFLGGSLVPTGGHNPIEAWAQGVAVVVGPNTGNFREIMSSGERREILERVADGRGLRAALARSLADPGATALRGESARLFVSESRGAAAMTADSVAKLLSRSPGERAAAP
jgi:3-deoxy-D-manno-octulosonic-acid transferase